MLLGIYFANTVLIINTNHHMLNLSNLNKNILINLLSPTHLLGTMIYMPK